MKDTKRGIMICHGHCSASCRMDHKGRITEFEADGQNPKRERYDDAPSSDELDRLCSPGKDV